MSNRPETPMESLSRVVEVFERKSVEQETVYLNDYFKIKRGAALSILPHFQKFVA